MQPAGYCAIVSPVAVTRAIELRTAIPGPKSKAILERKERVIADPLSIFLPVVVDEARGATLTDVDGNTFIDFTGGVGCLNVGHSHPQVVAAAQEQLSRFSHTDFTIVPYEVYVTLAERLCELAPVRKPAKAAFFNAGTEAVENAIKFARSYTKRPAVIGFEGAFHGRTLLSMTLTSKTHPYKAGLGPFAPEVYRVPFPNAYRGPSSAEALEALERALVTQVAAESVAAIVIEPVQGEGGFVVAPPEFLQGVRRICDDNGIVMVADEVQTGFGRTGRMWGIEHSGVEPDLDHRGQVDRRGPATVGRDRQGGDHGRPRRLGDRRHLRRQPSRAGSCAGRAGRVRGGGPERARGRDRRDDPSADDSWQERWDAIGDVRGLGAMLAIELVHDRETKNPAPELASAVVEAASERGLLLLKSGIYSNCIRVLCPLVVSDAELDEALGVWEQALDASLA